MRNIGNPRLYFKVAYRTRSGLSDQLRVFVSTDCGETWSLRYNKSGASLASVSGNQGSIFTPAGMDQWKSEDFSLSNYGNAESLLVKFQNKSDAGNNIYIDDIQISGPLSVQDVTSAFSIQLSPNPAMGNAVLELEMPATERVSIMVADVTGRLVATLYHGSLEPGQHRFLIDGASLGNAGMYLVSVRSSNAIQVSKLLIQQ
jgi:hypothetical protein